MKTNFENVREKTRMKIYFLLSRTYGVSIFIDYCTAPATQRKVEGEERDIQLINVNQASSCLA